jgi:hypothetical protein
MMYFYSQFSYQHVSTAITAIFKVILLQQYKNTNMVSCVIAIPLQLKIIIFSVKIVQVI